MNFVISETNINANCLVDRQVMNFIKKVVKQQCGRELQDFQILKAFDLFYTVYSPPERRVTLENKMIVDGVIDAFGGMSEGSNWT